MSEPYGWEEWRANHPLPRPEEQRQAPGDTRTRPLTPAAALAFLASLRARYDQEDGE
jgi:hypothetical protein